MANGNGFIITKETWENLPAEQREWMLFDTVQDLHMRIKAVEKRPVADKCLAFIGGAFGGFVAALGLKFLGK